MLTAIIILDGYGYSEYVEGNATLAANTPVLDKLWEEKPHSFMRCSGLDVGLPPGQMGNSEVGHLNIGAGRIVYQELTRITKSIEDGDFFENPTLVEAVDQAVQGGKALHLLGLVSDGGVHSHNTHIYALLELAKRRGLDRVFVHCFLDGRDTPPNSGKTYVKELMEKMEELGVGKVSTISGRYYAMDRDNRWKRTLNSYDAMTVGFGESTDDPLAAIQSSYEEGVTDEFMEPTVVLENEAPVGMIRPGDSVIFFNFRPDRARQMTRALTEPEFDGFERKTGFLGLHYVTMTMYDTTMTNLKVAYAPQTVTNTLGSYLSDKGMRQLRIAETEKYAHVTYFFNGGVEKEYPLEDRILVPSPKVATYDLKPEMSAVEVTDRVVEAIQTQDYDLIVLNYANCDMVGHTGVFDAAVKAVETVDACLGRTLEALEKKGGVAIITADHGNAEQMIDPQTKKVFTAHTSNPVKCILFGKDDVQIRDGRLADLAPTILELQGLEKPQEMTGESLIVRL
ncbi:2,3-bisphosphoglycerate-independent phosphoglycerate mutase [Alkalibacter rhizosphaerae]|uniref:2,3-bisphosphoglycerate-independent phosphoglycerate mutase n=1 Tax=Alkalibacter rhizosphaerae TaxID=2815577 RepID=A0A975AHN8_9FIRM|nr:2,3-bisphosphoglycerate-independent phosphoglycerate mutase [Alkalibacter rhizosphaerae]QSX08213.1 2,3-bisphosphoglycerate-independent phosphoglycerate mutase [Alkalibacter rhizosphaerae]